MFRTRWFLFLPLFFPVVPLFAARIGGGGGSSGSVTLSTGTSGANSFIFNQNTLQAGSTFYSQSGNVNGTMTSFGVGQSTGFYTFGNSNFYPYLVDFGNNSVFGVAGYDVLSLNYLGAYAGGIRWTDTNSFGGVQQSGWWIENVNIPRGTSTGLILATGKTLEFGDASNSKYVAFKASDTVSSNTTWTLPAADASGCFQSDGAGNVSLGTCGGSSISSSSTSWIQNTLTPTTTTQVFSVSTGTIFSLIVSSQITSPGPLTQSEHYGAFSQANSSGSTAIGYNASASSVSMHNTVVGSNSKINSSTQGSPAGESTVVGADSTCDGHNCTAVGGAQTVSANGVGVGYGNTVGNAGTAVGISLTVGGNAVAMGLVANAGATNSIALARAADSSAGGVAIGYQSKTTAAGDVALASRSDGSVGGTKVRLQGNSSTTSQQTLAQLFSAWADSTHATRKSRLDLLNTDFNGDRTFLRGEADGTTSVVGVGIASSTTNVKLTVFIDSNTYGGVVIKSTVSQTANPLEFWDSNNVVKSSVSADGNIWVSTINVKAIRFNDGTVQISSPPAGGSASVTGLGPPIAVGTGTAANFTTNVTSPTMAIDLEGADFTSTALGTTNYVKLNNSGVVAGSYTTPTITVDAKGRITSATSVAASTGTNAIFSSTMDFKDQNSTAISTITASYGVGSLTLASNFFTQGQSLDFYAVGYSSGAGSGAATLRIRVSIGSTTVMDSGAIAYNASLANTSNTFFRIDGNLTCRTTGTSGTFMGQVTWRNVLGASSPGGPANAVSEMFPTKLTTTTVDTTASNNFNLSFQLGAANTTDGLVITNYVVAKN